MIKCKLDYNAFSKMVKNAASMNNTSDVYIDALWDLYDGAELPTPCSVFFDNLFQYTEYLNASDVLSHWDNYTPHIEGTEEDKAEDVLEQLGYLYTKVNDDGETFYLIVM